jgi:drug/metabolite transporter (DMT)-like permease
VGDLVLLGVAVAAVSTSAPLIRGADAPTLSIALWRNLLSLPLLAIWLVARHEERAAWRDRSVRDRRLSRLAGIFLAAHFATWIPSLSYTSVASSVALVATQPVWAALIARYRGEHIERGTWWGIAMALAGTIVLTGVDLSVSARAVGGDLLALAGGVLAAAYFTVGGELRQRVSTVGYSLSCYGTASLVLLGVCVVGRQPLTGYETEAWLTIAGLVLGPQMLGHTVANVVLRSISATAVSVAVLFEVIGATAIARVAFGETPPAGAWPAAGLILVGVILVVRSERAGEPELVEPGGLLT